MDGLRAWVQASRLPSQTYIAFPILLGQMAALAMGYTWSWIGFALAQLFGLFDQLYIVYANDYADVETDRGNETFNMFSGGSRAIVEGKLAREAVGRAAVLMVALSLAAGGGLWTLTGSPTPLVLIAIGLLLLWAYSYRPVLMSYRGAGELLQMAGVGAVLPMVGFVAHGAPLGGFPLALLAITLPISLACAVATSLPDEPSDRRSRKRTASVVLGPVRAQLLVLALAVTTLVAWVVVPMVGAGVEALPALTLRLAAVAVPAALLAWAALRSGALPGTPHLTAFVTLVVAANVTFFLAASVVIGLG